MKRNVLILSVLIVNLLIAFQVKSATIRTDSLYSKWMIDSRMGDFRNNSPTITISFLTPTTSRTAPWGYVPGLVAKAILKAYEQYKTDPRCAYYFTGIKDYADNVNMSLGASNIDDLNAGKIFFELYRVATEKGLTANATTYKTKATTCRNTLKNSHTRIASPLLGNGGFWHKLIYVNQMWLDGLYMGPALYAEWQGNFGAELGVTDNNASWDDIALQFDTIFKYTWDPAKKLNYHAWSAQPLNNESDFWADPVTGRSQEFWGRGMGWFFAALVDVLEYMPTTHPARSRLVSYTNQVADGLKLRQDATSGCWYQLLQYNNTKQGTSCSNYNYLESSASSMFTYAYFKGVRLGVLDSITYTPVAKKAFKGIVNNFVDEEVGNSKIKLKQSCQSAGLSDTRKGDANYYICGSDVTINNNTEGKVLGPFIMASLEYEKITVFSFSNQPTDNQVECIGDLLNLGTVSVNTTIPTTFQWYSNTTKSNVGGISVGSANGGNTATFTPPSTTPGTKYYYCKASNDDFSKTSDAVQITISPATAISSQSTATATYSQNASATALTVTAAGTGLSYQWYSSTDASTGTTGDDVTVGSNSNSYTPSTETSGTLYYYCKVTGGCAPTTVTSNISGAIVICIAPVYSTQPIDLQSECIGGTLTLGTVVASNATSYQWYSTATKTNSGGTTVSSGNGGNTATYTPPSTTAGTYYYYCVATSTTCTTASTAVQITISPATAISSQSTAAANYSQNASATALTVIAAGTGLSYQWYSSTDASTSTTGDDVTVGSNSNSYTPSTTTLGTLYYYCKVSGGCTPTTVTSAISGAITVAQVTKILYLTANATLSATDTQLYPNLIGNSKYIITKRAVLSSAQTLSAYSAYDLIIISEDIGSTNAEIVGLKNIDKNILSLKSFLYGPPTAKWNWGTPDNGKANNGTVTVKQPTHPIFNGLTLTNGTLNLLSGAVTKGIQPVDLTLVGGINVALAPKVATPFNLAVAIHDVPASVRGVSNSKYLLVAICNDSYAKMTTDALTLFNNAIEYLLNGTQFIPIPLFIRNSNGSWETSADNTNWSQDVVIPSASNISDLTVTSPNTFTLSNNTSINNLSVSSGSTLNIPAAKQLTVATTMVNNGTLNLLSDATGTATIITPTTITGSGIANVNQYLTTAVNGRNWYMSSPVAGATSNVIKSKSGSQLLSYNEANTGTPLWTEITSTTVPLNLMQGYVARLATNDVVTFSGSLNTGTKSITNLTRVGTVSSGFNLIGNPYASYVNWASAIKSNVSNSIWYRSKSTGTYLFQTYNVSGEGVGTNLGSEIIPPMQSFWVRVTSGAGSVEFQNTMRSHQDQSIASNRLKAPSASTQKLLRLQVSNNLNSDETVVYFNSNASNLFDEFDSPKMRNKNVNIPEIYTVVGNEQLVINGLNNIETNNEIAIGFSTLSSNSFNFKATEVRNFDIDTRIILKDKVLNSEIDLTEGAVYNFDSEANNDIARFSILFRSPTIYSGIENNLLDETILLFKNMNNQITIQWNKEISGNVSLSNLIGQNLFTIPVKGTETIIDKKLTPGVYFITFMTEGAKITRKIIIN